MNAAPAPVPAHAAAPTSAVAKAKLRLPDKFQPKASIVPWLKAMYNYFSFQHVATPQQGFLLANNVSNDIYDLLSQEDENHPGFLADHTLVSAWLKERYISPHSVEDASNALPLLKMKGVDLETYERQFIKLLAQSQQVESSTIRGYFLNGLNESAIPAGLKSMVTLFRTSTTTIKEMCTQASRLLKAQEKNGVSSSQPQFQSQPFSKRKMGSFQPKSFEAKKARGNSVPPKTSNTTQSVCFSCGKPGHKSVDCRNPKPGFPFRPAKQSFTSQQPGSKDKGKGQLNSKSKQPRSTKSTGRPQWNNFKDKPQSSAQGAIHSLQQQVQQLTKAVYTQAQPQQPQQPFQLPHPQQSTRWAEGNALQMVQPQQPQFLAQEQYPPQARKLTNFTRQ
jgi:hypothetical protein